MTALVPEAVRIPAADRREIFGIAGLLLTYPDAGLVGAAGELEDAVAGIRDEAAREMLEAFLAWLVATPPIAVERHYVQSFDLRRRSGLFLTYYLHGDTRKRGIALLTLKQRYRAHGLSLAPGELPDYLPVVLEFAATVGAGEGEAPLRQHRRGLELLRIALEEGGSPYQHVVQAVVRALPPLTDADRAAIAELALAGPPAESVGLDPYGACAPRTLDAVGLGPDLGQRP